MLSPHLEKTEDLGPALGNLLDAANQDHQPLFENLSAWNALDDLGTKIAPWLEELRETQRRLTERSRRPPQGVRSKLRRVILRRLDPSYKEPKKPKNRRIPASSERR